jgi:hypothetical protein
VRWGCADIPGVAQVMGAANGMTRHIGGGRQLQGLVHTLLCPLSIPLAESQEVERPF